MPRVALALLAGMVCCGAVHAAARSQAIAADVPRGPLPDTVKPVAYRLAFTIDPAKTRFSGHAEIDVVLARPSKTLYLHGMGLNVAVAQVKAGRKTLSARYTQVDDSGVARLDLPAEIPAGSLTLTFDYSAAYRTGDEGLYHAKVGEDWYAWTQMEPIDARRMFPGFDEPGFKTPFTVTVTAPASTRVFANSPESGASPLGSMTVHRFRATKPLPTYLVAVGVGPFDVLETTVPPNGARMTPLPFRVIATKGQLPRMQFASVEGPKLLGMIETYLGSAYPFDKLDFLASPLEGGAMENAGLIIFQDTLILLDQDAPLRQLRGFAEVSAHEMAHQWFGDLVTPTWWTDIWLNESFAEWMGKKVAEQWNPALGVGASELEDAFAAMDTDSLDRGRPIHQVITENKQVASAFDSITYQKGAQVLSMFENFLGPETFLKGVKLHLSRHQNGNASADDFFRALGEAAGDPKLVQAMQTFTEQTGVPVITVTNSAQGLTLAQQRYRPLGVMPTSPQTWHIPFCMSRGTIKNCTLLEATSTPASSPAGTAPLMPNANGSGYYRFRLDAAGWDSLIAASATLPARDSLALADSLWADFAAGSGSFARVIAGARSLSEHSERLAVVELAARLKALADSELDPGDLPGYRRFMSTVYGRRLADLGFDPRAGAHGGEPIARQALRQSLVAYAAVEGHDPALRARLSTAAADYLGGDRQTLDAAFRGVALKVAVQERGAPFIDELFKAMLASSDPLFRSEASAVLGAGETPALAEMALRLAFSPGVQPLETLRIVFAVAASPATRDTALNYSDKNFKRVIESFPGFARTRFVSLFDGLCTAGDVARIEAYMAPKLKTIGGGELELAQTKERIGQCAALKQAKGAEISAVFDEIAGDSARQRAR